MDGAPNLYEKVRFESPAPVSDGYGGPVDGWTEEFTLRAAFRWLRGGETVQQARLLGRSVLVITIRRSTDSLTITPEWRAVDARTEAIFNVRSILPTLDRAFLEITCETGVQP